MKITDVKVTPVVAQQSGPLSGYLPHQNELSSKIRTGYTSCFVQITTDDGTQGVGESLVREVPEATANIVDRLFKPLLLGRDPFDIDVLWELMYATLRTRGHNRGYLIEALSGVDIALWDVLGKATKKPVHKLIGGAQSTELKAYASSILFGTPQEVSSEAARLVEEGHRQIKIKVGMGEDEDEANLKATRDKVGYGIDIMVDANSAFNAHRAIQMGRRFEKYECYWFEEPVPPDDINGYIEVSRKLDIPIAGGESHFTRYDFRDLISLGAIDVVMPDVGRAGGISECKKIAAIASAFGKSYSTHVGLSGVGVRAASLQLAASLPKELFSSYELYSIRGRENPLGSALAKKSIENFKGGFVKVPQEPGLGIELDGQALERFAVK